MKRLAVILLSLFVSINIFADQSPNSAPKKPKNKFVKELMEQMTIKQMVGQLFMIHSYSSLDSVSYKEVVKSIDSNYIGGVCFFKGTSKELIKLNQMYAEHSRLPLFVAIDGEWGLNMRLTDIETFPMAMTMGALPEHKYSLVYDMGKNIAKQCKSLGININFAPDVDINLNPSNPVINMRSFGQDKQKVALLAEQYVKGMQDEGVMAVIKHFPGHGDTETDSHKATPLISHSKEFIDTVDTYPFRYNIKKGVWGVMVAHLQVDALSEDKQAPASINKDIIQKYLLDDLKFKGLVFTDAMNMKGVSSRFSNGEAEVRVLEAGADIILMPDNLENAYNAIMKAIEEGRISEKLIREKCKKILLWKYEMGLFDKKANLKGVNPSLVQQQKKLNTEFAQNTITLLGTNAEVLPLNKYKDSITLITIGNADFSTLEKEMKQYCSLSVLNLKSNMKKQVRDSILRDISPNQRLVTAIGGARHSTIAKYYGIPDCSISVLQQIQSIRGDSNIVLMFANPYVFKLIDSSYSCGAFLMAYENNAYTQKAASDAIFGNIYPQGFLPVTVNQTKVGELKPLPIEDEVLYKRFIDLGLDYKQIKKIDSLCNNGIKEGAYPGCQLFVARKGEVLMNNCYGFLTYDSLSPVETNTMYDIASLTKVMATTLAVMKLYEYDKLELYHKASKYLPELKNTDAGNLTITELLSHYSTMPATYAFGKAKGKKKTVQQVMLEDLKKIKGGSKKYLYSDVNFVILQLIVERVSGMSMDAYLDKYFYNKMGLKNLCFNPLQHGHSLEQIAPTEVDSTRGGLIHGQVHDPTAYFAQGVCGNAGLFASAEDLSALCLMLLNGGVYDGNRYLDGEVVNTFNKRYFQNQGIRRALGFDKPFINGGSTHCSKYATQSSFGHSGFTGTYLWIDPEQELLVIFLSNRVHPSAKDNKLSKMNIRTDIHDLLYKL